MDEILENLKIAVSVRALCSGHVLDVLEGMNATYDTPLFSALTYYLEDFVDSAEIKCDTFIYILTCFAIFSGKEVEVSLTQEDELLFDNYINDIFTRHYHAEECEVDIETFLEVSKTREESSVIFEALEHIMRTCYYMNNLFVSKEAEVQTDDFFEAEAQFHDSIKVEESYCSGTLDDTNSLRNYRDDDPLFTTETVYNK